MELYYFGFGHHCLADGPWPSSTLSTPLRVLCAHTIDILWLSSLDSLVVTRGRPASTQTARGEITAVYKDGVVLENCMVKSGPCSRRPPAAYVRSSKFRELLDTGANVMFGEKVGDGMKGIIKPFLPPSISFFTSLDDASFAEAKKIEFETFPKTCLLQIAVASSERVYAIATTNGQLDTLPDTLLSFTSLVDLHRMLQDGEDISAASHVLVPRSQGLLWTTILTNATTTTALTVSGQVYTWTTDNRFPACLGREVTPDSPAHRPSPVPYLSETFITKIASGGYMTAALSRDGEVFLWGQAAPGTEGEIAVLKGKQDSNAQSGASSASINLGRPVDNDQDEYVKCVELRVPGGNKARAYHVAVGLGHVLVAAAAGPQRGVFAAGLNKQGQLGLSNAEGPSGYREPGFQSEFAEIASLREKKVISLAAAGWSSWVVTECKKGLKDWVFSLQSASRAS